jgi:hypothetical protein
MLFLSLTKAQVPDAQIPLLQTCARGGLVLDGKLMKDIKKHDVELGTEAKLNFSNYPTRKKRDDNGTSWADRRRSED